MGAPESNLEASKATPAAHNHGKESVQVIKTESLETTQNLPNEGAAEENEAPGDEEQGELSDSDLNMEDVGDYENGKNTQPPNDNPEDTEFAGMEDLPLE